MSIKELYENNRKIFIEASLASHRKSWEAMKEQYEILSNLNSDPSVGKKLPIAHAREFIENIASRALVFLARMCELSLGFGDAKDVETAINLTFGSEEEYSKSQTAVYVPLELAKRKIRVAIEESVEDAKVKLRLNKVC